MRKILFLLLIFPASILAQTAEETAIKATLKGYSDAIVNKNGEEALKFSDAKTIAYFASVVQNVKTADSTALTKLTFMENMMILSMRGRATRDEIYSFDGKKALVYAVNNSFIGKQTFEGSTINTITITGNTAKAPIIYSGNEIPFVFDFTKEGANWKLNLVSLFQFVEDAINPAIQQSGMNRAEFIKITMESMPGKRPGVNLWQSVK